MVMMKIGYFAFFMSASGLYTGHLGVRYIRVILRLRSMFFGIAELQERIVHIERYLDGKTTYMWPESPQSPWEEKWLKEYLGILRDEYYRKRRLHLDKAHSGRLLK